MLFQLLSILNIALGHVTWPRPRGCKFQSALEPMASTTPQHTPFPSPRLPLCHESQWEGGFKRMTWSQKKPCPLRKRRGFPRWESWRRKGVLVSVLLRWAQAISHLNPAFPSLLQQCLPPDLPIIFSCLSESSRVSLEATQDHSWPLFQMVSDFSLISEPNRDPAGPAFSCSAFWGSFALHVQ